MKLWAEVDERHRRAKLYAQRAALVKEFQATFDKRGAWIAIERAKLANKIKSIEAAIKQPPLPFAGRSGGN